MFAILRSRRLLSAGLLVTALASLCLMALPGTALAARPYANQVSSFDLSNTQNPLAFERVVLYQDKSYSGDQQTFITHDRRFYYQHVGNDKLSSLKIYGAQQVILYEHTDYGGSSLSLTCDASYPSWGGEEDLGIYSFNDKTSSMRIYGNDSRAVVLHEDENQQGQNYLFYEDDEALPANSVDGLTCQNDDIEDHQCCNGATGTLYQHSNYGGTEWSIP